MAADIRKVALLMSCLPRRLAASLLERLPDEYGGKIRHCLAEMTDIDDHEREQVVREFLSSAKPSDSRRYRIDAGQSLPPSFHFLLPLSAAQIVDLLADEMPQTQAAVLTQLPPNRASAILALLPTQRRQQVSRRLKSLKPIPALAMNDIAQILRQILGRRDEVRG